MRRSPLRKLLYGFIDLVRRGIVSTVTGDEGDTKFFRVANRYYLDNSESRSKFEESRVYMVKCLARRTELRTECRIEIRSWGQREELYRRLSGIDSAWINQATSSGASPTRVSIRNAADPLSFALLYIRRCIFLPRWTAFSLPNDRRVAWHESSSRNDVDRLTVAFLKTSYHSDFVSRVILLCARAFDARSALKTSNMRANVNKQTNMEWKNRSNTLAEKLKMYASKVHVVYVRDIINTQRLNGKFCGNSAPANMSTRSGKASAGIEGLSGADITSEWQQLRRRLRTLLRINSRGVTNVSSTAWIV